jgi:tetratricopeptide (TPR) repeat protein
VAATLIAAATYLAGAIQAPPSPIAGPAGDATTIDGSTGVGSTLVPPGAAGTLIAGSVEQLDRSISIWAANVAREPRDFLSATTLAELYHARGRLTGDLADQERALEAVATAQRAAPGEAAARTIEASVRLTLHDFDGALGIAEALVRDDPMQLGALAALADAKLELGRIADARADYDRLAAAASGPALDIRLARLASVSGDAEEAVRLSRSALDASRAADAAGETVELGFYQYAAAEYARLAGDAVAARAGFEAALAERATDLGALVGLARIDAFEGRTDEAVDHLRRAASIAPQPETLALLGDLLAAAGDAAGAARQFETVRFIERLGEVQATVFDRVLLRFDLDHGAASTATLTTAQASFEARPDAGGHDTVAWALYRLGRGDEAAAEIAAAGGAESADARVAFHAGAIALAAGDSAVGRSTLERVLALGPALDPIERLEAERLLAHDPVQQPAS